MKFSFKNIVVPAVAMLLWASTLNAGIPESPVPQRLVNDFAGVFTLQQRQGLESELVAFDDSTSNQIAVVSVASLDGMSSAEYATELHRKWGVGGSRNNGIVILVKPKIRNEYGDVFISVGYGLEGAIPDAYCKRIIENDMIPHFREGDYYGAVEAALEQLKALACGEISEPRYDSDNGLDMDKDDVIGMLIIAFMILIFIILLVIFAVKNGGGGNGNSGGSYRGGRTIFIPSSGRGFSSGGSGGGGFSGGGFGGFGGGMAGGGGAGGRW